VCDLFCVNGTLHLNSVNKSTLANVDVMIVLQGLSVIGVQQIDRIVEVVEETFKGIYHFSSFHKLRC